MAVRHKGRKLGREGTKGRAISSLAVDERDFGFLLSIGMREGEAARKRKRSFSFNETLRGSLMIRRRKQKENYCTSTARIRNLTGATNTYIRRTQDVQYPLLFVYFGSEMRHHWVGLTYSRRYGSRANTQKNIVLLPREAIILLICLLSNNSYCSSTKDISR